jgi:ubiquitination network signaling protein AcrB
MPPRSSAAAKRQQGNSPRDTRHENGLVGPGKRIPRQKSQNSLNHGTSRPVADNCSIPTAPPPLPPTAAYGSPSSLHTMAPDYRPAEPVRRASLGTSFDSSSTESLMIAAVTNGGEENHRRIDVNAAKNANVHRDPGPIDLALTVLRSCPLYDTIAILIILMQLSPFALSSIYMLFTLLTFVPPVTTSSGLSLTDIFEGSLGTPSLSTLACMDIVVLLMWLFLSGPLQSLILDFAQVVIALTLGGGASSRQGSTNNIVVCMLMVLFTHFRRNTGLHRLSRITFLSGASRLVPSRQDDGLEAAPEPMARKGASSWIRNLLAIHILTQGVVRYIREWYLRREKRDLLSQSLSDAEAGTKSSLAVEIMPDGPSNQPDTDGAAAGTASVVSVKKKRKQSAQVRFRQPLWAALASTKIVMVKEYELSHAAHESAGSEATDVDNLGNAPFHSQPRQIWICYIGHDEVCFNTSAFPEPDDVLENGHSPGSTDIDISKPFYVKVNRVPWRLIRITHIDEGEGGVIPGTRWRGDIEGLAPLSTYEIQFVCTRTGDSLFSTSVRTAPAPSADAETPKGNSQPRRRHESPATTIRASIATQEAKLNEEKSKFKTLRKEHHRRVNALKKETDKISSAAQSAGSNDDKLRQKITQNQFQEKQADQSIAQLESELKDVDFIPDNVIRLHRDRQDAWNAEKAQFEGARAKFKSFKSSIDLQVKELEEERANQQSKRNKIAGRIAKAVADHSRITNANIKGVDEAERRRQERASLQNAYTQSETIWRTRIQQIRESNDEKSHHVDALKTSMRAYLSHFDTEAPYDGDTHAQQYGVVPWTSNASQHHQGGVMWPSSTAHTGTALAASAPPFQPMSQPPIAHQLPRTRGRSSSMLSDVSGFTQSSAADEETGINGIAGTDVHHGQVVGSGPVLRGPPGFAFARGRGSPGSGSGGSMVGSGSGSSVHSGTGTGSAGPTSPV